MRVLMVAGHKLNLLWNLCEDHIVMTYTIMDVDGKVSSNFEERGNEVEIFERAELYLSLPGHFKDLSVMTQDQYEENKAENEDFWNVVNASLSDLNGNVDG